MMENDEMSANSARTVKANGGNEYGLTDREYYTNVILFCLLFTCFSFNFWLTDFQAEYLGTDMYVLFYAQGCVSIVSGQINLVLYDKLGFKSLIIYTQTITIAAATFIVLVQERVISLKEADQELVFVNVAIPVTIVLMSTSIQVGYTAIFQSVYQDERLLPFNKKATATNIIILVSKTVTIGAPFVNELEEPIPIVVIIVLAIASIVIALFFKSKEELDQMQKVDTQLAAMMSAVSKNGDAFN